MTNQSVHLLMSARLFSNLKINIIYPINNPPKENYITISLNEEKSVGKIQHPFLKENTIRKLIIEWNFLKLIKGITKKSTANATISETLEFVSIYKRSRARHDACLYHLTMC